ncbi:hypothetical protein B0H13DRAFT_513243 [Mycena leptocephala]|nr:hypothetical protein B0H13DRAFT_513243 [Mycena leptocephala]
MGWPEGQLYFFRQGPLRVVTEAYLYRPGTMENLCHWIEHIEGLLSDAELIFSETSSSSSNLKEKIVLTICGPCNLHSILAGELGDRSARSPTGFIDLTPEDSAGRIVLGSCRTFPYALTGSSDSKT